MNIPKYLRVLYAEDNEDAGLMVTTILEFSDIIVTTSNTIAEAWKLAQAEYFDLYLLDSNFPDGSGLDLCRQLREYSRHTPILFYSAAAYTTDIENGLAAGANGYLTKPYFDDLALTIQLAVKKTKKPVVESYDNFFAELKSVQVL